MLSGKCILATALFSSLSFISTGLADWEQPKTGYWGASGTASCHNYENISVWVGMSYADHTQALTELWSKAVTACLDKEGLYNVSGAAYSHQGPYW